MLKGRPKPKPKPKPKQKQKHREKNLELKENPYLQLTELEAPLLPPLDLSSPLV
jgi:hypothetical protein